MQNLMVMFTFSFFNRKYPFWTNLIQKIKTVSLSQNLILKLIRICRIQWRDVHLYCFLPEAPFLGKYCPKDQNCQFKLKFGTKTNTNNTKLQNIQNLMVVFNFSLSEPKYPFWTIWSKKSKLSV